MKLNKLERRATTQVNAALHQAGLSGWHELPGGSPCEPEDCPVKRALEPVGRIKSVAMNRVYVPDVATAQALATAWQRKFTSRSNGYSVRLPWSIRWLILAYDTLIWRHHWLLDYTGPAYEKVGGGLVVGRGSMAQRVLTEDWTDLVDAICDGGTHEHACV